MSGAGNMNTVGETPHYSIVALLDSSQPIW
jgi:hypothetical protein